MHVAQAIHTPNTRSEFSTLPKGMERAGFIALVEAVAPFLGVKPAAMATWRTMIAMTKPSDFKSGETDPCCYQSQAEVAKLRRVTASRIREHERTLQTAGLIDLRTMENGARSGFSGCGVFFSPAIERVNEFLAMRSQIEADRRRHAKLRGLRSSHKRHLKSCLAELIERGGVTEEVVAISGVMQLWPKHQKLHTMSLEELIEHEAEADALCTKALELLNSVPETSCEPLENERSYIQDTTQESIKVSCNASDVEASAGESAHTGPSSRSTTGAPSCKERYNGMEIGAHNSEILSKIPIQHFVPLASPDMRLYLDIRLHGRAGGWSSLYLHDFTVAAQNRLPDLGISQSAWEEAVQKMGEETATWCVFITDAKAGDPETPILSPGGYLRGMTKAHEAGKLNIVGSLIGLSQRQTMH